ncbi:TonB-dependent receptor domain-containing protein [Spirosoma soli]|uniref:TonB-dependent receptor domain-containing protein n=1 Tax=Spirosoma soli TaxID=1770529 RepID=A0ABW5MDY4_9BACT
MNTSVLFRIINTALAGVFSLTTFAQGILIKGQVKDTKQQPAAFATVALLNSADSSLVKANVTDETGQFTFEALQSGSYRISVSSVGFDKWTSAPVQATENAAVTTINVELKAIATNLSEVKVTARKPLIEVLPDKTVFNVSSSINATGSTALELLQKSPGVMVDRDDNILLQGNNGVRIYIDGKPSPLSPKDLAAYLRTLQSSDIESIEIITQPSARFDAAGNAGILNIRLKKDKRLGTNGSLTIGLAQGLYYPKFNGSLSLNHRTKKINWFSNYSNRTARDWSYINMYREQVGTFFDQRSQNRSRSVGHNFKGGADVFINPKSTIGFMVNGNVNGSTSENASRTPIGPINAPATSILLANNQNTSDRFNLNTNLNYRYADTSGHELNIDADYGRFRSMGDQFQPNRYVDPSEMNTILERNYRMNTQTNIDIYTVKADYEQRLWKGKLGLGVKLSSVRTDNGFNFYDLFDSRSVLNMDRTNQFVYTEQISAAYVSYNRQAGKWSYQAGLRVEDTRSEGNLTSDRAQADANVQRHYLNAFPSAGLTYSHNPKNSFALNYSRRIDRPTYQDLNPFESKLDELSYAKGNAFLRPQYTNNIQLSHTYNYKLTTTLAYSRTTDYFTAITDTTNDGQPRTYITTRNLSSRESISLGISYPFQITKWWNVYANVNAYRSTNRADLGQGRLIQLTVNALSVYAQQTISLPNKISLELSGFYNSPSVWGGTFLNQRFWGMDLGLQRKVLNERGTLKLTLTDVFHSMQWHGISQFGGLYMDASGGYESRQIRVNFTYNFGNNQVKAARQRKTGLEDESLRIK